MVSKGFLFVRKKHLLCSEESGIAYVRGDHVAWRKPSKLLVVFPRKRKAKETIFDHFWPFLIIFDGFFSKTMWSDQNFDVTDWVSVSEAAERAPPIDAEAVGAQHGFRSKRKKLPRKKWQSISNPSWKIFVYQTLLLLRLWFFHLGLQHCLPELMPTWAALTCLAAVWRKIWQSRSHTSSRRKRLQSCIFPRSRKDFCVNTFSGSVCRGRRERSCYTQDFETSWVTCKVGLCILDEWWVVAFPAIFVTHFWCLALWHSVKIGVEMVRMVSQTKTHWHLFICTEAWTKPQEVSAQNQFFDSTCFGISRCLVAGR